MSPYYGQLDQRQRSEKQTLLQPTGTKCQAVCLTENCKQSMDLAGDLSHPMFHVQYLSPVELYIFEVPLHSFADDAMTVPAPDLSVLGRSSLSPSLPRPIRFKTTTSQSRDTDASLVSLHSRSASSFLHRRRVPRISTPASFFSSYPPRIFLATFSTSLQRPPLTRILAAGILACSFSTYSSQPPLYTSRALLSIVESLCFAVH
jgi:hypothetical protein